MEPVRGGINEKTRKEKKKEEEKKKIDRNKKKASLFEKEVKVAENDEEGLSEGFSKKFR